MTNKESTPIPGMEPGYAVSGASDIVNVAQRTEALLRGLCLIFRHHGAPETVIDQLRFQLKQYLDICESESVWVKHVKHALAYPLAKYLKNEPPKSPGRVFKPVGDLKKWMKLRLCYLNRKNTHLWYSWFQAKRAALPMSDEIVDQTYHDHFQALVRDDDGQDDIIEGIFDIPAFQLVLKTIADYVEDTCDFDSFAERQPSTNACFENTRKEGGQQVELLRLVRKVDSDTVVESVLHSMKWHPKAYTKAGLIINVIEEIREAEGRDVWSRMFGLRDEMTVKENLSCTIQAVLEPMKVRVISKGEALPYYCMRPLQKALWSSMKDMPCFRLISRPFSPTDAMDLRERADCNDEWFSVDYSAATDGLSWKYSGEILKHVISQLPLRYQEIAMSVLGPHKLHYPLPKGVTAYTGEREKIFRGVMRRGQLMGSILSFPILCLANLGVYLYAMRDHHKDWSISDQLNHVLVNGDDMLYAAPAKFWGEHIQVGKAVGLEMSIGKSYHHPVYANVNSTSIHYDLRERSSTPWQIDFLNVGLYFGQHKVQGGSEDKAANHHDVDEKTAMTTILPTLLKGALPGREGDILKMYLSKHKDLIYQETQATYTELTDDGRRIRGQFSRNLFLPLSIGGMGVDAPNGFNVRVTKAQRKLAVLMLIQNDSIPRTSQYPLPGWPIEATVAVQPRPWSIVTPLFLKKEYNFTDIPCLNICDLKYRSFIEYGESPNCSYVTPRAERVPFVPPRQTIVFE